MIAAGFEVHHIDANRENDHPDNLVLIEAIDHARLHGKTLYIPPRNYPVDITKGQRGYELKTGFGWSWGHIATQLDLSINSIIKNARAYATCTGKPWPLPQTRRGMKKKPYKRPVYRGY